MLFYVCIGFWYQGLCSTTILKNILGLFLHDFENFENFHMFPSSWKILENKSKIVLKNDS